MKRWNLADYLCNSGQSVQVADATVDTKTHVNAWSQSCQMDVVREQIDRNELLATTRAVFVKTFAEGLESSINQGVERLFEKADRCKTASDQRRYLDARGILQKQNSQLQTQLKKSMEKMLHRSFQTTYSNYRPSFPNSLLDGQVSLIDTSVFEDELRFNSITDSFRNEAGEQLRDLNIRIALLFEQDNIRERENPFRPYLFSRTIALAVESLGTTADLNNTLTEQLSDDFSGQISTIYAAVNAHLAEHGIAAQLMLKPKRSPNVPYRSQRDDQEQQSGYVSTGQFAAQNRQPSAPAASQQMPAAIPADQAELQNPVERLFRSVKALAARPFRAGSGSGGSASQELANQNAGNQGGSFGGTGSDTFGNAANRPSGGNFGGYGASSHNANGSGGSTGGGSYSGNAGGGYASGSVFSPDQRSVGGAHPANFDSHGNAYSSDGSAQGGFATSGQGSLFGDAGAHDHSGESAGFAQGEGASSHAGGYGGTNGGNNGGIHGQGAYSSNGGSQGGGGLTRGQQNGHEFANNEQTGYQAYGAPGQPGHDGSSEGEYADAANSSARPNWLSGKRAVGDVLRRFFAGKSAPDDFADSSSEAIGDEAPPRPARGMLSSSVHRLMRYDTPSTEEMYSSDGDIRNLIMERRSNLNEMAHDSKEQMTIDIVSMLFEFILRDTQVPAEVRAQLGRLQFLVLKIALRDESLLTTKAHPARMLVNRIGSISLGLKQIDASGENITAEICRIVEAILSDETESSDLFLKMLDELDTFIARELLDNDKSVSGAVEVVEQAESRTLRLAHATAQVSEALAGLNIHEHLQSFLENDWARAIEHAERNNPDLASEYRLLVPDLLWSVLPKVTAEDRQQLLALLPPILKTIHGGMDSVGWPAGNKQTLMDWLFDAHTMVLRGSNSPTPPLSFSATHAHFQKFVENLETQPQAIPAPVTSVNRKEYLEEAMRELDVRINLLDHFFDDGSDLQEDDEALGPGAEQADAEAPPDIAERLRTGVAIEVNLGGKPSAGRLHWINPNAANLVLTLHDQPEPSMISVRMFRRLLNNDRVRFLETEPLFERAVETLLLTASQI